MRAWKKERKRVKKQLAQITRARNDNWDGGSGGRGDRKFAINGITVH